ncbi:hypothetical protein D9M68_905240 [compost metagenome]
MKLANSAGVPPPGSAPSAASVARSAGLASADFVASESLASTSFGVPAGASNPAHEVTGKPLMPASCMVGSSGDADERAPEVTASPLSLPLRAWPMALGMVSKPNCTSLDMSASMAGPPPL